MAPLFFFLASSLNVELVYIILKSITQFQYVCMSQEDLEVCPVKLGKVRIISDPHAEDVTLELKKIKIQDSSLWDMRGTQLKHNERCATEPVEFETMDDLIAGKKVTIDSADTITMNETVHVTFYRMKTFRTTFKEQLVKLD